MPEPDGAPVLIFIDGWGMVPLRNVCPECRGDGCCHHMPEFTWECCTCQGEGVNPFDRPDPPDKRAKMKPFTIEAVSSPDAPDKAEATT
jgi:hypothetical protein